MDKYITNEQFSEVFSKLKDEPLKLTYEECFCKYKGYFLPGNAIDCVKDLPTWEVRSDDVWNLSYPKTGSTWLQEIICAAMYNGDLRNMKKQHQEMRMMFLDGHVLPPEELIKLKIPMKHKIADEMTSPRIIKSHFTGPLLPPQLWHKKPKILYILRNPKDLAVSMFHFQKVVLQVPEIRNQSFAEFLDEMISGELWYGPWWEHYLFFWKKRHESNVLLLRFEDTRRVLLLRTSDFIRYNYHIDVIGPGKSLVALPVINLVFNLVLDALHPVDETEEATWLNWSPVFIRKDKYRGQVEKVSKFLGTDCSDEKLAAITDYCSFQNMKENNTTNPGFLFESKDRQNETFMRKGIVGEWKLHFTVAQNEVFTAHIKEKLYGTGLTFEND